MINNKSNKYISVPSNLFLNYNIMININVFLK